VLGSGSAGTQPNEGYPGLRQPVGKVMLRSPLKHDLSQAWRTSPENWPQTWFDTWRSAR
jgi:hypothetical protein